MHVVAPERLVQAINRSQGYLVSQQHADGFWVGELEANTTLTSEYIFFRHLIGQVDRDREAKIVAYLLSEQLPDGGWTLYYGGPSDLSTTVEAYVAMRLAGVAADALSLARERIHALGGLSHVRVFTKIFLALFGQFDWRGIPVIPPEIISLPQSFYFNIYEFSSWSRSVIIPLAVIFAKKPLYHLPPDCRHLAEELFVEPPGSARYAIKPREKRLSWELVFVLLDGILKASEKYTSPMLRETALRQCEQWILEHQDHTGDWGGIMPAMINSVLALVFLGYPVDSGPVAKGLEAIERFGIEEGESFRLQACVSPVWDTVLSVTALADSGMPRTQLPMRKALLWLLSKQVRRDGDWSVKNRRGEPGGWSFEFNNDFYPDNDDTAAVLIALHKAGLPDEEKGDAMQLGLRWLLSMQCDDGGWGAFDVNNNKTLINKIPFADLESLLDPSTCDLTGRALELLGLIGFPRSHRIVERAVRFIRQNQEVDGPWYGRWGVNYIYGTCHVLCGLHAVGENMRQPYIRRALQWLIDHQNADGGWGESCRSYEEPEAYRGVGKSTASQTGWALMGLMAAGIVRHSSVARGTTFLLRTQNASGTWNEPEFTGTGFPKYFFIKYHMYQHYFPLMALARYHSLTRDS